MSSREPYERQEHVQVDEQGGEELRENMDVAAEKQNQIDKIKNIIWMVLAILEVLIGFRVILKVLAANPDNSFASLIYRVSRVFLLLFFGVVGEPAAGGGGVLETSSIIGMVVYFLVFLAIVKLVQISMQSTKVRDVSTMQRH